MYGKSVMSFEVYVVSLRFSLFYLIRFHCGSQETLTWMLEGHRLCVLFISFLVRPLKKIGQANESYFEVLYDHEFVKLMA